MSFWESRRLKILLGECPDFKEVSRYSILEARLKLKSRRAETGLKIQSVLLRLPWSKAMSLEEEWLF